MTFEVTQDELVDDHPGGHGSKACGQHHQTWLFPGHGEGQHHHREEPEEELGQRLFDRRAGGDRVHADVVVDGVHFMDAVETFGVLVEILLGVGDRVVALVLVREILLDDLAGHARALAGRLAAVIDTVEMEMDADAIGEGIGRIVRGGQRDPPDRGEVGGDQRDQRDQGQPTNYLVLFVHAAALCLTRPAVSREWLPERRPGNQFAAFYFFLPPALGLHIAPGICRLA